MPHWLADIEIIGGPVPLIVWGLTLAGLVALCMRRPRVAWVTSAAIGAVVGAAAGIGAVLIANATGAFGGPLPGVVGAWAAAGLAALGFAVGSLRRARVWRKVVALLVAILALLSAGIGVNASYGIDRTLGSVFGISTLAPIGALGDPPHSSESSTDSKPLYERWKPPADMPQVGKVGLLSGDQAIPSTAGFVPRDASIYLPPAALTPNAPALPLVVMMMGQPGNPDPSFIQHAMDDLAAKHQGLAPIVIVADQIGNPQQDPLCVDSPKYGGVATYFNSDIVNYAKTKLNIIQDPAYWTIAGYSNGGACAYTWGTQHPDIWGNIVSISGEKFPGSENPARAVADVYAGDEAAYNANKPETWMQQNAGKFAGHVAAFTVGENDATYLPVARESEALAKQAGFATNLYVVPGAGHVQDALAGGLPEAFGLLYPHLGLAAK